MGKFYLYTLFYTTIQFYHQFRDIFINTTFINEQKTIVPLPYLLLNHRLFLSLFEIHLLLDLPSRSAVSVEIRRLRRDPPSPSRSAISLSHTTGDENGLQRIAIQSLQMLIPVQDSQLVCL